MAALSHAWQTFYKPAVDALFSPNTDPLQRIVDYLEVAKKIRQILAAELRYFEAAIREAIARQVVEPCETAPARLGRVFKPSLRGIAGSGTRERFVLATKASRLPLPCFHGFEDTL